MWFSHSNIVHLPALPFSTAKYFQFHAVQFLCATTTYTVSRHRQQPSCKSFITFTLTRTYNLTKYLDVGSILRSLQCSHWPYAGQGILTWKVRTRIVNGGVHVKVKAVINYSFCIYPLEKYIFSWLAHWHIRWEWGYFPWMAAVM